MKYLLTTLLLVVATATTAQFRDVHTHVMGIGAHNNITYPYVTNNIGLPLVYIVRDSTFLIYYDPNKIVGRCSVCSKWIAIPVQQRPDTVYVGDNVPCMNAKPGKT